MAGAATSTIRACRRSCARFPRAPSTIATACRWPPAIGDELEKHRADYQALGIDIDRACPRTESPPLSVRRPDVRPARAICARAPAGAPPTLAFVERDSARRLRGYDDRPTLVEVKNPSHRQDGSRAALRLSRTGAAAAPPPRAAIIPKCAACWTGRATSACRSMRASQVKVAEILRNQLKQAGKTKGAAVVMDPATGDLLAAVSFPLPCRGPTMPRTRANPYLDRARYGLYPPGSTFKVVTAMAALRKDAQLAHKTYQCVRLPDGRVGNFLQGLQAAHPRRRTGQDAARHARSGARPGGLLQRLLRAIGRLRCGRGCAARYRQRCWASPPRRRIRRRS